MSPLTRPVATYQHSEGEKKEEEEEEEKGEEEEEEEEMRVGERED